MYLQKINEFLTIPLGDSCECFTEWRIFEVRYIYFKTRSNWRHTIKHTHSMLKQRCEIYSKWIHLIDLVDTIEDVSYKKYKYSPIKLL